MRILLFRQIVPCLFAILPVLPCTAATFGTVVPVRGTVSDIALDESRNRLYAANFSAGQIAVIDTASRTQVDTFRVPLPPSCLAISANHRFLVVGEYDSTITLPITPVGIFSVFDLNSGIRQDVAIDGAPLAVAFGAGNNAFLVTTAGVFLVDPTAMVIIPLVPEKLTSLNLPVPLATFPGQIAQAAAGVSGDGNTIAVLATTATGSQYLLMRYFIPRHSLTIEGYVTSPPLGPYSVAVDQTGGNVLAGWTLLRFLDQSYLWAEFPNSTGTPNIGTNAWDSGRNVIYAQQVVAGDGPVLHVLDTDNLTVRDRIRIPENLAGRSLISSDDQTMYSVSVSGVTVLPIGNLSKTSRIGTKQESLLFQGDSCSVAKLTQTLDVVDFSNAGGDFSLSVPPGITGVHILSATGVTPAKVTIQVDPAAFQSAKGTVTIPLTLTSSAGVNLPSTVRLLINTRNFNQRGTIFNIPGRIVDLRADPVRNRFYLIRQDKNLVLVYDVPTMTQIATLRTGNTPTQMSITADGQFLLVGNDNSQIANVFDLDALQAVNPILFPFGHYPRAFGVTTTDIFATARVVGGSPNATNVSAAIDGVDLLNGFAGMLPGLGIYQNNLSSPNGALAESPDKRLLMLVLPDGNVVEYDSYAGTWVASRHDLHALGGAYGIFYDNLFLADNNLLNGELVPVGQFPTATGYSSGMGMSGGVGMRTTAQSPTGPGLIERVNPLTFATYNGTALAEAPLQPSDLQTATVGVTGETVLPFIRGLAVAADQNTILMLTQSGITMLTQSFDGLTIPPTITGITNPADGSGLVAPGGLVTIAGRGLASGGASAGSLPLPTSLGDTCVSVNSIALPLFQVSPSSIMAQLPFNVTGSATVTVADPGGVSSNFKLTILSDAPAVFHTGSAQGQNGLATIIRDDNQQLVDFTNPIHPNQTITIYLTGMGRTDSDPDLGAAAPASPLARVSATPSVMLGSVSLGVMFAGLTPGEVGVYQIDAQVPGRVDAGSSIPLTIVQGGVSTSLPVRVVSP